MKRNFLHFLSNESAIININGQKVGIIDSSQPQIDIISKTNKLYVSYTPISQKQQAIPYTCILNTETTPTTTNEYIKIVPFPNNHYDIILTPFYYYQLSQSKILFNNSIGKYFVSVISNTTTQITIYLQNAVVFTLNTIELESVFVKEKKEFIIIEGIINPNTYQLIIIDTNDFSIIFNDTTQSIEEDNYHITSFKSLNTLCKHAEVSTFDFQTKEKDKYYVYEKDSNNINPALIPFAFLECISVSDETKAKSFLSDNLSNSTISQLQNFFGKIENIYINRYDINVYKQNYTIESNKMKNYNFLLENKKIIDIQEVF